MISTHTVQLTGEFQPRVAPVDDEPALPSSSDNQETEHSAVGHSADEEVRGGYGIEQLYTGMLLSHASHAYHYSFKVHH